MGAGGARFCSRRRAPGWRAGAELRRAVWQGSGNDPMTMNLSRTPWLAFAALAVFCGLSACGSSGGNSRFGDDGGADGSTSGLDAAAGSGDTGVGLFGNGEGGGPQCSVHCSADLHDVVDCNGNVVTQCPATQGCGANGQCVAACDAATANKSTLGCDYYAVDPGTDGEANGSCFAAYVANTWGSPVSIAIEYAGKMVDASPYAFVPSGQGASIVYTPLSTTNNQLAPNQLAIVFMADATPVTAPALPTPCPAGTKAFYTAAEASSEATAIINSFHLTTTAPVAAYDIFPYGGSASYISSATLLIPSSAWDTNYLAIDAFAQSAVAGPKAQPFIEVAASQDATQVTILPKVDIVGGAGVAAGVANKPVTYTLNHGQVLQLKQDAELSGSPIQSDKPIGVWGGISCFNIGLSDCCCDSGHQQLPPVQAFGSEYVAVKYRDRGAAPEDPPWRLMGAVNGTTLTYEPAAPNGAPTALAIGQVALFYAGSPFVVKSQDAQHPFYVSGHMTSQQFMGTDYGTGDPEFVNLIPPAEWLASYVFMTDPTMANTNLVLTRKAGANGAYADVKLDCLGTVTGWLPIGSTPYQLARVDLVTAGAGQQGCNNGRHQITSSAPFGLTVWGWDQYVSYAYPSGASVQPVNTVVVPPTPQ